MNVEDVWAMSNRELAELLANGHAIDPDALRGDYRGVSLGLPGWVVALTWKVFRKTFRHDGGRIVGHNVRMAQPSSVTPLADGGERTEPLQKNGAPFEFGPYVVRELPADGTPFHCKAGLLIDYGPTHPAWSPMSRVRDPLVALRSGDATLLFGASYVDGPIGLRTPTFFTLEKE